MDKEVIKRVEEAFKKRCISLNIKFKSKKFYEMQIEFFIGAMVAINEKVPMWVICIGSGREIVEY